ncbi:helix-turn-helix domain-containing protein [Flavobacterium sp. F52]|uniref:helix-turn-helix domain-containing protein n=1 Tax=Flavobacterium sp. F52 TaxID=1202532 RepID=UPI0002ED76DB|nr:AraC family transcriptional regulator [Flavobacterium sp. F52]
MLPSLTNMRKIKDIIQAMDLRVFDYMDNDDFSIVRFEDLEFTYPFQSLTCRPDFFQLNIMTEAHSFYEVGCETYLLTSNWILLVKPDVYISCRHLENTKGYHISFNSSFLSKFSQIQIKTFSAIANSNAVILCLNPRQMSAVEQSCLNIYNKAVSNSPIKYEIIGNLLTFLLIKLQQFKDEKIAGLTALTLNKQDDIIEVFFQNLEKNFSDLALGKTTRIYRTKDYADLQNLDKSYLSKHISNSTDKTINCWIKERTIDEIKYLLKHTQKPLKEISGIYGFYDQNYFFSYFKKHTGISPYNFRKLWHKHFPLKYPQT